MDLHEYQAKSLMRDFGIVELLDGFLIPKESEIEDVLKCAFDKHSICVVKAQVHAGGRGKAGGVKVCKSIADAVDFSKNLFKKERLVTNQTSKEGQFISALYCEAGCAISKEFYLSMIVDRESNSVSLVVSTEGGMDIEEVAHDTPEKIHVMNVDFISGYMPFHTKKLCDFLNLDLKKYSKKLHHLVSKLYSFFVSMDLSMLEINPLVLTNGTDEDPDGDFVVLDAKVNVDDNGLFRHKDIIAMRDKTQEDCLESKARDCNLSYVKLDGSIGCMVNGAGLAMATMDIIQLYGSEPANFLDVGGAADLESVKIALGIILEDRDVKAILINIFGGIVRCDIIANAIVGASKSLLNEGKSLPTMVVRLAGTKSDLGLEILSESGLNIVTADDLDDAAKKVVNLVK
jgi:succinyl-CoA synthetase beta subunit